MIISMSECFWCGHSNGVMVDWLIYPHRTDAVPPLEHNQVACCTACRSLRGGRGIAGWSADCLEQGIRVDLKKVYEALLQLDQDHPTPRTGVELRKLRTMLDMRYNPSIARLERLRKLFDRSGRLCIWCGKPLSIHHLESSVEHLVPRSRQGNDHPENLLLACIDCNNHRRNKSPAQWIEHCIREGYQPRIDLIWESLSKLQQAEKGIRIRRRAHDYQQELLDLLAQPGMEQQPHLPLQPWRIPDKPPATKPKKRKK